MCSSLLKLRGAVELLVSILWGPRKSVKMSVGGYFLEIIVMSIYSWCFSKLAVVSRVVEIHEKIIDIHINSEKVI